MPQIEVDNETAQRVAAQAAAQGVSPGEYLRAIVPAAVSGSNAMPSMDELDAELESLALELPTLPEDFSRADIYDDHD